LINRSNAYVSGKNKNTPYYRVGVKKRKEKKNSLI